MTNTETKRTNTVFYVAVHEEHQGSLAAKHHEIMTRVLAGEIGAKAELDRFTKDDIYTIA